MNSARSTAEAWSGPNNAVAVTVALVELSVIIVNFNTAHLLADSINALERSAKRISLQIIVVDNASRDNSVAVLSSMTDRLEVIFNETNIGFGRANNQALPRVRGEYVLLLNTDAFVAPETIERTLEFMRDNPGCGVVGVRLVGRDGSLQPSCRYFPTVTNTCISAAGLQSLFSGRDGVDDMAWDHASTRSCDWVPGCYYLVRKNVIDQVGLFDPRYFLYFEEVDHCRAVKRAGWEVMFFPGTAVVHLGGESAKSEGELTATGRQISELQIESEMLYFYKHHGQLGVLATVASTVVGVVVACVKRLVRGARAADPSLHLKHLRKTFSIMRLTRFGRVPTR